MDPPVPGNLPRSYRRGTLGRVHRACCGTHGSRNTRSRLSGGQWLFLGAHVHRDDVGPSATIPQPACSCCRHRSHYQRSPSRRRLAPLGWLLAWPRYRRVAVASPRRRGPHTRLSFSPGTQVSFWRGGRRICAPPRTRRRAWFRSGSRLRSRCGMTRGLAAANRQLGVPGFGRILASGLCGMALTVSAVCCS